METKETVLIRNRGRIQLRKRILRGALLCLITGGILSCSRDEIRVIQSDEGFALQVEGRPFTVKGMNWDYKPIGTNYRYSLWSQTDEIIQEALDREMGMMQSIGVNAVRIYTGIQPRWVEYIYENYGIYTMLNHSFGRYGVMLNGEYVQHTDYADPETQELLLGEVREMVETYRATPGLLIWLLGNENNYGLFWKAAETEALPGEEGPERERARQMYRLFNRGAREIKALDGERPVALANGDLQFLDIINEEIDAVDIFGSNIYRGLSFGDAFMRVRDELGLPILFTEFGSDAFNARTGREDQHSQAGYLLANWQEIYANTAGKGLADNSLGGFTFQFSDGWWKTGQERNLDIHDSTASWPNGGYLEDYVQGQNNMNEEWFGICAKGPADEQGLYELYPRAAYYALEEIHRLEPLHRDIGLEDIEAHFKNIQVLEIE